MRIKTTYRKEKPVIQLGDVKNCNVVIDANYRKRTTLNECIDEIYMACNRHLPQLQPAVDGRRDHIARNISFLLDNQYFTSMERNKFLKARRKLFSVDPRKSVLRKQRKPKYRKTLGSTLTLNYRSIRSYLRRTRVRKNVLNKVTINADDDDDDDDDDSDKIQAVEEPQQPTGIQSEHSIDDKLNGNDLSQATEYVTMESVKEHENALPMEEDEDEEGIALMRAQIWAESQYNIGLETHGKIMEETLRTVYYLKTLASLMCY